MSFTTNFEIEILTRSIIPTGARNTLFIKGDGNCTYKSQPDQTNAKINEEKFHLTSDVLEKIYQFVQDDFFSMTSQDSGTIDGDEVQIRIKAKDRENTILLTNYPELKIEQMVHNINREIPEKFRISYTALVRSEL